MSQPIPLPTVEPEYEPSAVKEWAAFFFVSCYLGTIWPFLIVTGRLRPTVGIIRIVLLLVASRANLILGRTAGSITAASIRPKQGHCWIATIPLLPSDCESRSRLQLFEDGRLLGPAHAPQTEVVQYGSGRFSHWARSLFFSSSDNTDPGQNGRVYTFRIV